MSDRIILKKDGFKHIEWDGEAKSQHTIREGKNAVLLIKKDTEEIVGRFNTTEEAEKRFWIEKEVNFSLIPFLRFSLEVDAEATIEDFITALKNREELAMICDLLFPGCWRNYDTSESCTIQKCAKVNNGVLTYDFIAHRGEGNFFKIDTDIRFTLERDAMIIPGYLIFLEVLNAMFGPEDRTTIYFDADVAEARLATGEQIDFRHLLNPVEILGDLTPESLFRWVAKDDAVKEFIAAYSNCAAIDEFHEEAKKPADETDSGKFRYSTVTRSIEISRFNEKNSVRESFDDSFDYGARGDITEDIRKDYESMGKTPPTEQSYSVGWSPVGDYSHLPLILNPQVKITKNPLYSRKMRPLEPQENLGTATYTYTLLEVLDTIYDDISFYGAPAKRDEFAEETIGRVEDIKLCLPDLEEKEKVTKVFGTWQEMLDHDSEKEPYRFYRVDHSLDTTPDEPSEEDYPTHEGKVYPEWE